MTSPSSRRRSQAPVPSHRLQALGQGRRAGNGRSHRVRPEPFRLHRTAALRRRREALHHRPEGIKQGDVIETGAQADIKPGNNLPLRNIPTGTVVHAIELRPLGGAKIARSAGAAVQLVAKDGAYAQLRMPSGEIRNVGCSLPRNRR